MRIHRTTVRGLGITIIRTDIVTTNNNTVTQTAMTTARIVTADMIVTLGPRSVTRGQCTHMIIDGRSSTCLLMFMK